MIEPRDGAGALLTSLASSRVHWEDLGALDPCWAILSQPGTRYGGWDREKFFATGEEEISAVMNAAQQLELPRNFHRALDFGCGIGRLTRALASRFQQVVGLDISQSMIDQAIGLGLPNCRFLVNDSSSLPFDADQFDFIYTAIVLQHVPSQKLIRRYIAEFVRTLKPGGLLVMQLPSYVPLRRRLQARRRLYAWLRSAGIPEHILYDQLGLHPIPMNFLPEREVTATVAGAEGKVLRTVADQRAGPHITSRTYYATRSKD